MNEKFHHYFVFCALILSNFSGQALAESIPNDLSGPISSGIPFSFVDISKDSGQTSNNSILRTAPKQVDSDPDFQKLVDKWDGYRSGYQKKSLQIYGMQKTAEIAVDVAGGQAMDMLSKGGGEKIKRMMPVFQVAEKTVKKTLTVMVDKVGEHFKAQAEKNFYLLGTDAFQHYRQTVNDRQRNLTTREAITYLKEEYLPKVLELEKKHPNASPAELSYLRGLYEANISEQMVVVAANQQNQIEQTQTEVVKVLETEKQIFQTAKVVMNLAVKVEESYENTKKATADQAAHVDFLGKIIQTQVVGGIDAMHMAVYMNSSDDIKIKLLEDPNFLPNMDKPKRQEWDKEAKKNKLNVQIIANIQSSFTVANDLCQILNVPPKTAKMVSQITKIGGAAFGAVSSFYTGNYMGMIGAVTSLFMKSTDPSAGRHEEIMKSLGKLFELSQTIIENQKIIMNKIDRMELTLNSKLKAIREDIMFNRMYLVELTRQQNYGQMTCYTFLKDRAQRAYYNTQNGYHNYEDLVGHLTGFSPSKCISGLNLLFHDTEKIPGIFLTESYLYKDENHEKIERINFFKTLGKYVELEQKEKSFQLEDLVAQAISTPHLLLAPRTLAPSKDLRNSFNAEDLFVALDSEKISLSTWYLLEMIPYFEVMQDILGETSRPLDRKEFISFSANERSARTEVIITLLKRALYLVEVALLQEQFHAGAGLYSLLDRSINFPLLSRYANNTVEKPKGNELNTEKGIAYNHEQQLFPGHTLALNLLRHSPLLARNFMTYKISRPFLERPIGYREYSTAERQMDYLFSSLELDIPLRRGVDSGRFYAVIEGDRAEDTRDLLPVFNIPIPPTEFMKHPSIAYSQQFTKLHLLREEIVDNLARYDMILSHPDQAQELLTGLYEIIN
ncbi:MAG: hypothetical protein WCG27_05665, partial [Pseudomonadota bacterium]